MKGWEGHRPGPCTAGEAKTLTAIMSGAEPEEIEAFIVIVTVKCENCGHPHNVVTNLNIHPEDAIQLLGIAIGKMVEEMNQ